MGLDDVARRARRPAGDARVLAMARLLSRASRECVDWEMNLGSRLAERDLNRIREIRIREAASRCPEEGPEA